MLQGGGFGDKRVCSIVLSIDTYAAGGVAVTVPIAYDGVIVANVNKGYSGYFNSTTGKLMLFTGGSEAASVASAVAVSLIFFGKGK